MTVSEAITRTDTFLPNQYTNEEKTRWLDQLDRSIKAQIIDTHQGAGAISFSGYEFFSSHMTELLAPPPFDEMYLRWLEAQIHYHNDEYDEYNASIAMYNTIYNNYANYYKRTHLPISQGCRFVF